MDLGIAGRSAIVCASSRGLGFACADALAREGVGVTINGRDAASLDEAARLLAERHEVAVHAVVGDIADESTRDALFGAFGSGWRVNFGGNSWAQGTDVCNYVEDGSMSVGWNGDVSPCWPLLHTHGSYLHGQPRSSVRHVIGNVRERGLMDLWLDPAYVAYRERVQGFGFPPCTFCGGCDISDANVEDCFGNPFPTCGACLWSQGVLKCP